ncbi:MAG TPA: hypothetical protein VK155_04415 [Bacteroidales bacterium]|nr:hypothetical protein [Bacteroidales bacterium]
MTLEEVKSSVLKKVRKTGSITILRNIERLIDKPVNPSDQRMTRQLKEKIEASRRDIEMGKFIENKLLRKEVRIWLKNR